MPQVSSVRHDIGIGWYEEADQDRTLWSLILVSYGKCIYWVDQEKITLAKGDLLIIPHRTAFYGKSIPTLSHEKYVVTFAASDETPLLPVLSTPTYIKWKTAKYELFLERFRLMYGQWNDPLPYHEVMCRALLIEVLTHWNRELDQGRRSTVKLRHVELMQSYIKDHYREKVTKDVLGKVIGKSPNYAAALFSEVAGQAISDYVHALRMKTADYLLRHSQLTIGDISSYLGYCDISYFYRVFKRTHGSCPAAYLQERERVLF